MKQYSVLDYIIAIIIFTTIIAIITKNKVVEGFIYYVLWVTIIIEVSAYGSELKSLLQPIQQIGK